LPRLAGLAVLAAVCLQTLAGVAGAADWVKVYADENWYRQQAGEEQVFDGKLEAVEPPQASTLMRNALYKLGDRTIYTGAKKLPALDALAGKTVEIRGKAVNMELSGQAVREIWPAAIRPVFIRPESVATPAPQPGELVLRSPITIEKISYSVLPRLSAEAGLGEKRDQAIQLLGRNGFAVIRNAAAKKVFLDRLAQAGLEVLIHIHQLAGIANDAIVKSLKSLGLDTSKEGIYTVTGYYEADASPGPKPTGPIPFWGGQIATAPIEIEIKPVEPGTDAQRESKAQSERQAEIEREQQIERERELKQRTINEQQGQ